MTEPIRVSRWILAVFAAAVAGVAGLLAFVVFFVSSSSGQMAWTKLCVLAAAVVAALIVGRKAKPDRPRVAPTAPAAVPDDYSGLPASPSVGPNALPFVLAGVGIGVSFVCLIVGFLVAVGAGWAGSEAGIYAGIGIAAIGPTLVAVAWVVR